MTDRKDSNRSSMPTVAGVVDSFREFFPDLSVTHCEEGGRSMGRKDLDEGLSVAHMVLGQKARKDVDQKRRDDLAVWEKGRKKKPPAS